MEHDITVRPTIVVPGTNVYQHHVDIEPTIEVHHAKRRNNMLKHTVLCTSPIHTLIKLYTSKISKFDLIFMKVLKNL